MIKKTLLLAVVVSQLAISCSSDDHSEPTLTEQISTIVKQPYSKLSPADQKVKLEAEANEMLTQLDKSKSSGAIEAMENLSRLLDLSSVDIFNGKNGNEVEDILNVSGVYGIYTWNNTNQNWDKTNSATELKFFFPAKASQTANNASFSSKSTSSDIKVKIEDSYDWKTGVETNDFVFLPLTADAILTIDGTQAATFNQNAKYSNGKETPDEFAYKMTLNDGYTWEMSSKKGASNSAKAILTFNGKSLIDFNSGSTANIDGLIDNDKLVQYRGKANGLIQLMDNFVIVADMDLATEATDKAALNKSLIYPNYNSSTYIDDVSNYNLKKAEGTAANFNKNMKLILVSKKDGTKIADIVQHSLKEDNGNASIQYYYATNYLKFNDNTEVEMSSYFSDVFDTLNTKFDDFIAAFNK